MAGLLTRLGRGLGAAMTSYGTSMLEQQKQDRLEQLKKEGWAVQTAEGEKDRASREAIAEADRKSREKIAGDRAEAKTYKPATKDSNVSWEEVVDDEGNKIRTGSFTAQRPDRSWYRYDAETNTIKDLGKEGEQITELEDPEIKASFESKAKKFGAEWADDKAGWFETDSTSFKLLPEKYRSESKVSALINEALLDVYSQYGPEQAEKIYSQWSNLSDGDVLLGKLNNWLKYKNRL